MWIARALAGLVAGHVLRRAAPWLANVKSEKMPFRWPWLEVLAALALIPVTGPWILFTLLLLAITATDFHVKLIPDRVSYPGAAAGLACSALFPDAICGFLNHDVLLRVAGLDAGTMGGLALGVAGAAAGFGVLEAFRRGVGAIVGMEVMGMGDSKLLLMMGAFLGPSMILLSLVPALTAGIVLGYPYTKLAKTPHLPFGPALALGGYVTLLWGGAILDAWFGLILSARSMSPKASGALSLVLMGVAIALLLRVRRRRAEYTRQIEEDYDQLDER